MKVGHGLAPLEVPVGTALGGYADRGQLSTGTADPLQVHAITVQDGSLRWALVVVDAICVNTDLTSLVDTQARAAGVDLVWTCATHTHSGPETGCRPGGAPTPAPWLKVISVAAAAAIAAAVASEEPARLQQSTTKVPNVASVRRFGDGLIDLPVDVLQVRSTSGTDQLIGVLGILPIHPTVLPAASTVASADLHGAVRRALGRALGSDSWVVMATGAAGDISTRGVRRGRDLPECDRLAELFSVAIQKTIRAIEVPASPTTGAGTSSRLLAWRSAPVMLRTAHHAPEEFGQGPGMEPDDPLSRQAYTLRQAIESVSTITGTTEEITAWVHVLRMGDLTFVGLPGEPFLDLREQLEALVASDGNGRASRALLLLGYVNGYVGYLPTRSAYEVPCYESVVSPIAPGESERLVATAAGLSAYLNRAPGDPVAHIHAQYPTKESPSV